MSANQITEIAAPGDEPLTFFERLPNATQEIIEAERREASKAWAATDAKLRELEDVRIDLADAVLELRSNERHPKPDPKRQARLETRIQKIKDKRDAIQKKYDDADAMRPGHKMALIDDAVPSLFRRNRRIEVFGITDTPAPGKSLRDTTAELADLHRQKRAERDQIIKAPQTRDEIEDGLRGDMETAAADIAARARFTRRVNYVEGHDGVGRFERREFKFPSKNIPNGLGGLSTVGDGLGFVLAMFPDEIADKLTALALEGYDPSKAIDMGERVARLEAVDAEILMIERRHEYWVRQAREEAVNPGPRISNDIRAVLDLA